MALQRYLIGWPHGQGGTCYGGHMPLACRCDGYVWVFANDRRNYEVLRRASVNVKALRIMRHSYCTTAREVDAIVDQRVAGRVCQNNPLVIRVTDSLANIAVRGQTRPSLVIWVA